MGVETNIEAKLEGELKSLPSALRQEVAQLHTDITGAAPVEKAALQDVTTAIEGKTATRKEVIDSIKLSLDKAGAGRFNRRLVALQAKLETVRIGFEPAIDASVNTTAAGWEGLKGAGSLGMQGVTETGKMPLLMSIPLISGLIGGGAYALSWFKKKVLRYKDTPTLDKYAKWGLRIGAVGAAVNVGMSMASNNAKSDEKKGVETPPKPATKTTPAEPTLEYAPSPEEKPKA